MKAAPPLRPSRGYAARSIAPIDRYLASRVKQARSIRGISRQTLAELTGYSLGQMEKWEAAENRLSAAHLYFIALALQVTPGWFYEGYGDTSAYQEIEDDAATNLFAHRLLKLFRSMAPEHQAQIRRNMEDFAAFNARASAGTAVEAEGG